MRGLVLLALAYLPWPTLAYDFSEVAPGVHVHAAAHEEATVENLGAYANHGFIVGDEAVAVFDPGGTLSAGLRLREAMARVTSLPVRYVIATHDHPDHSFGAVAFQGAEFIGHSRLGDALERRGRFLLERTFEALGVVADGTRIRLPSRTVPNDEPLLLDLGNRTLRLDAWPTAHTDNDVTIIDQRSGTLLAGDLVFVDRLPVVDGSLLGWLDVIGQLRALPVRQVVPGHGPAVSEWPGALVPMEHYLTALRDDVREAIADGVPMLDVVQAASAARSDSFVLFEQYHPRNVTSAYKELEWE